MAIPLIFGGTAAQWKCWAQLITSCTPWELVFADSAWALASCWTCNCDLCNDLLPPYPAWQPGPMFFTAWPNCTFWYSSVAQIKALLWDTDVLVKTDDTDVPWYLYPKIVTIGCIKKRLWAAWANHTVEIYLDKDCLALTTEDLTDWPTPWTCTAITAVDMGDGEWCPVCDEECVKQTLVTCGDELSWECDECSEAWLRKPRAKMILDNWFTQIQENWEELSYYVSEVSIPRLDSLWWIRKNTLFQQHMKRHKIDTANSVVKILAPWDYHIEYTGNYEQNKAIHATRIWLLHVPALATDDIKELAQTRFSWLSDDFYPGQNAWYVGKHEWNYPNNEHTSFNGGTGPQSSIGRLFERLPFAWSTIEHLKPNDLVVFFYKISTFMVADVDAADVDGEVSFRWYNDSGVLANDAVKFDVYNIDDTCDRRYWNKKYSIG